MLGDTSRSQKDKSPGSPGRSLDGPGSQRLEAGRGGAGPSAGEGEEGLGMVAGMAAPMTVLQAAELCAHSG